MARHIAWIIICMAIVVTDARIMRFQSARNYVRTFTNGPEGECEFVTRRDEQVVNCSSAWVGNGTVSSARKTLAHRRRCIYFKKTSIYLCYGTNLGRNGSVTCTKRVSYYTVTPRCSDSWLNWERCDKPCGGGKTTRVRFSMSGDKYEQMTEIRPCNTHKCAHWGPWRPELANNGNSSCNITTCTMVWERDCLYDKRAIPANLCTDVRSNNNSRDQIFLARRETDCSVHECTKPTTRQNISRSTEFLDGSLKTTKPRAYSNTKVTTKASTLMNTTSTTFSQRSSGTSVAFAMQVVAVDGAQEEKIIWVGFGIGFLVASVVLIAAFLVRKLLFRKGTRKEQQHRGNWKSARAENAKEYAHTAFRLERIPSSTEEKRAYATEQQQAEPALIHDVHEQNDSGSSAVNDATADTIQRPSDPLYSHIPVYEPDTNNCYPSSEFESINEDSEEREISSCGRSSDVDKDTGMVLRCFDVAEEVCKPFDSDESRDVVHTLRKQSTRSKRSPLGTNDLGDVFLSDEEVEKNEHDTDHKFAFSRRYSKMLAKKARKSLSRKPNQPVEAGFQWIEGRRWTASTNSDCSTHSTPQPLDSTSIGGSRKLSNRSSLGACSVTSFNVDASTSGYNSAIGDSTDEEYSVRHKRRLASSQSSPRRYVTRRKSLLGERPYRSLTINTSFATERRNHFCGTRLQPQSSCLDQGISSSTVADTQQKSPIVRPFLTVRPSYQRSVSLISRRGRIISIDDIYSNPIDAEVQDASATEYWEYELPIDALHSKSVFS